MFQLLAEIERLRKENSVLKEELASLRQSQGVAQVNIPSSYFHKDRKLKLSFNFSLSIQEIPHWCMACTL